jgi:hypothetical protein
MLQLRTLESQQIFEKFQNSLLQRRGQRSRGEGFVPYGQLRNWRNRAQYHEKTSELYLFHQLGDLLHEADNIKL